MFERNWKKTAAWIFAAILFGGLLYLIFVPRPVAVEIAKASRGTFRETILADGILRSKEKYTVPAFADGDIKRMPLKVGDAVKKGQVITELFWDVKYDPVRAPVEGVISKVYRESAGPIRRGEPIVEIVDPKHLEVMTELLTTDAIRLKEGSPIEVLNWPGSTAIGGTVTRVSKAGFVKPSALGVEEERTEVTADLANPSSELVARAGNSFHVDLSLQVSVTENALKIPSGALIRDGASWAVYKVDAGRAVLTPVEISGHGSAEAAVARGLAEGERVVLYPGDLVRNGTKVKPREGSR